MRFTGKYIAKMNSLKKFLVSECFFKLVCFCESCRESGKVYLLKKLWYWYDFIFRVFLITMHKIDTAAEVYLEPFPTYVWAFLQIVNALKIKAIHLNWHSCKYALQLEIVFHITLKMKLEHFTAQRPKLSTKNRQR